MRKIFTSIKSLDKHIKGVGIYYKGSIIVVINADIKCKDLVQAKIVDVVNHTKKTYIL